MSTEQANFDGRVPYGSGKEGINRQQTTAVASFPANAWGLFDMHGNLWEWCQDRYAKYPRRALKDPIGPKRGRDRILRGGCWWNRAVYCRAAWRFFNPPANRDLTMGFRAAFAG